MKEKKDDFLEKVRRWSIQIVEEKKREKQMVFVHL